MSSRSLVICDKEEGYATALATYLTKQKEFAFQIQVCNEPVKLTEMQKQQKIDILLINEMYCKVKNKELTAGKILILTEHYIQDPKQRKRKLYKYQSGEALLAQIINIFEEDGKGRILSHRKALGQKKIIGIFSPVHRCGKTSYALELGKEMAISDRVLYLGMEVYGGRSGYFSVEGQTIVDALYYSRQEGESLGVMLPGLVENMDGLDYLAPAKVSEDIREINAGDWIDFVKKVLESSSYNVIIMDLDDGVRGIYEILRSCTEVHVPTLTDKVSLGKLFQFEEELQLLGYDDVKRKLIKKEQIL